MLGKVYGSLTKEPPLTTIDTVMEIARPGMAYQDLYREAISSGRSHADAPVLARNRFLTLDPSQRVVATPLLDLIRQHGAASAQVRKTMYFVWAIRDGRIGNFVLQRIADDGGHWQPIEIANLANAEYFEQYMNSASAKKARSNYQFFLTESSIYRPATESVHLELDDGWLAYATSTVAVQQEDSSFKAALVNDPLGVLVDNRMTGLINVSEDEARAVRKRLQSSIAGAVQWPATVNTKSPVYGSNKGGAERPVRGSAWSGSGVLEISGAAANVLFNKVALERATNAHRALEEYVAAALKNNRLEPLQTPLIDLYFQCADEKWTIIEIKSCDAKNYHAQVRKALSQLLEYTYLYKSSLAEVHLTIVTEIPPPAKKSWLIDYLGSLNVSLVWRDAERDCFTMKGDVPVELAAFVAPA